MKRVWNASPKRLIPKKYKRERDTYPKSNLKGGHNMGCLGPTLISMWYSRCVQLSFKKEFLEWLNVETYKVTLRIMWSQCQRYIWCSTLTYDYMNYVIFLILLSMSICLCPRRVWCLVSEYVFHRLKPVL